MYNNSVRQSPTVVEGDDSGVANDRCRAELFDQIIII